MSVKSLRILVSRSFWITLVALPLFSLVTGCASQQGPAPGAQSTASDTVPEAVTASQGPSISLIEAEEGEGSLRVIIKGSTSLTYNVTREEFPPRLVIDVAGAALTMPVDPISVHKGAVTEIKPSQVEVGGEKTARVEIGLATGAAQYEVIPAGNDLVVNFSGGEPAKPASSVTDFSIADAGTYVQVDITADGTMSNFTSFELDDPTRLVLDFPGLASAVPVKEKKAPGSLLKRVRCGQHPDRFRVVFESPATELPFSKVVPTTSGATVFFGTGFEGQSQTVATAVPASPQETSGDQEAAVLLASAEEGTKEESPSAAPATGDPAAASSAPAAPIEATPPIEASSTKAPETETSNQPVAAAASEQPEEEAQAEAPEVPPETEAGVVVPTYTGTRLSLDFKDADIRNILRLIAEVSNLNIIAGEDVQGTVTIRLNDVPWDQALDVILLSNNLGKTLDGNILRVAPLDRLTKEKQAAIAAREAAAKLEPIKKGLIPVSYAQAKELKTVVVNAKVLSPRGSLEVDDRTNTLIVLDVEEKILEVRRIVYQLDTPTPQVLIEAKVAQINPTFTRELGITWDAGYATTQGKDGVIGVGGAGGTTIDPVTGAVTSIGKIVDLAPGVGQGVGGGMSWAYLNDAFGLSQKLAALEKEEKAEILSSPRIMTLDNQEAIIEQGVDLPYLKLSEQGVTSTEFKKATLSLKVVPHVTSDGSIMMEVEVKKEQRSAQTGAGGAPGIDTRRATTKVLVRDNTTVVIGGIYEETSSDTKNSVPFLGRVPVVKWLFSSTAKKRDKTELIVFITPTIITIPKKPLLPQELQSIPES
jgi:type IV pilus secretin PilQ/predicted competence protein